MNIIRIPSTRHAVIRWPLKPQRYHLGGSLRACPSQGKHLSCEELRKAAVIDENGKRILDPAKNLKTVEEGTATSIWCATSQQLNGMGGVYCENWTSPVGAQGE
jgi:hypothetical protein